MCGDPFCDKLPRVASGSKQDKLIGPCEVLHFDLVWLECVREGKRGEAARKEARAPSWDGNP